MFVFLTILQALVSACLIGIILIQRSKGQGLGMSFGGGMGEAIFGAQMGNVLTRTTVVLAAVFLLNTTVLSIISSRRRIRSVVEDHPIEMTAPPRDPGYLPPDLPIEE